MRPMPELCVEEAATDDLVPYARNAKQHTNEQVGQIAASIEEFGFNDPVGVWDAPDGGIEIVEGHGRVLAARKLGIERVPVVRLDHLTDEQRRAYALVHNKLTLNTGWDFAALDAEIAELDFDFESLGFDPCGQQDIEPAGENGFEYREKYAIEVMCRDEEDQQEAYEALTGMGYECKVVVV